MADEVEQRVQRLRREEAASVVATEKYQEQAAELEAGRIASLTQLADEVLRNLGKRTAAVRHVGFERSGFESGFVVYFRANGKLRREQIIHLSVARIDQGPELTFQVFKSPNISKFVLRDEAASTCEEQILDDLAHCMANRTKPLDHDEGKRAFGRKTTVGHAGRLLGLTFFGLLWLVIMGGFILAFRGWFVPWVKGMFG